MIINSILEVLDDGRFVVVYNDDQILTMRCELPDNLDAFTSPEQLFLAGVAFSRLEGATNVPKIQVVESEDL